MFLPSFELKSTLAANANANFYDTLKTKKALETLGYYDSPNHGLTSYPDTKLFEGIKAFQPDYGLKKDGIMKPGGETVQNSDIALATNQSEAPPAAAPT